jgi:hypothetical protein
MRLNKSLLAFSRLIHVYVSMALLSLMIFFSITGITLNHPQWFAEQEAEVKEVELIIAQNLLSLESQGSLIDFLVTERFIKGNKLSIEREDEELFISDKGPGRYLSLTIDLVSGEAFIEATDYGYWALLNDLHKGRNSGDFWRFIIDLSAALMILFSLTGFILALAQRRMSKTVSLSIISTLLIIGIYFIWV